MLGLGELVIGRVLMEIGRDFDQLRGVGKRSASGSCLCKRCVAVGQKAQDRAVHLFGVFLGEGREVRIARLQVDHSASGT